jgi:hypothetical protein
MPGTLVITTLSDGTNSTSATNLTKAPCVAWVNWSGNASPTTIRAAYNVSSVTFNGGGDYTVNFTTALIDANYAATACSGLTGSGVSNSQSVLCIKEGSTPTSSAIRFTNNYGNGLLTNAGTCCVAVFR